MLFRIGMSDFKSKTDLSHLLLRAVKGNNLESVIEALDQGADVNAQDDRDVHVCIVV